MDGAQQGAALPLRQSAPIYRAALHVLPMRGGARDLMLGATALANVLVAAARPALVVKLIEWLLDLTPPRHAWRARWWTSKRWRRRPPGGRSGQHRAVAFKKYFSHDGTDPAIRPGGLARRRPGAICCLLCR